ncbi:protein kinase [Kovacikia minuta CCNUW1]|uniref:protein kinase domain-containing protein n=1 Tax=Kovacikia minuta TaxID=2931930 RepID=UPI001CC9EF14|nr:serine/threonine protein kinase [Kovacikia minuta]UBF27709.1 protein kinase [Kovacikia minuta CCNUW1]
MQPPIPSGTVLQDRYRILSVLGQGGFGRTYLAEDQGRFSELCALKELTPADTSAYALEKSEELFQREAQTLYQIKHPQIPEFRATFEYEQRLFLVQDYVEGQTYRKLLDQRRSQGYAFSEAEVKQLFLQLLPVLAYIHSKSIIHRDITPDNIILRAQDHLPVLIDFGVVKELATRFQSPGSMLPNATALQNTTVGKLGYAPIEQIQTGRAYPSSDLYSLAVTAVVLLTGREPQELLDDGTMTWYWQRWVRVDPGFAQIINRMLSYRPGDRYQSAIEVLQSMQTPSPTLPPPTVTPAYQPAAYQAASDSREPTMAVAREPVDTLPRSSHADSAIVPTRSSIWDDPLAVTAIGIGLVMLTGIGSWAIVRAVLNPSSPTPVPTQTQTITPSPSPTTTFSPRPPSPTPPPEPTTSSQRLDISPDTRLVQNGSLGANETINYIISAQQGQQLSVSVGGEGVLMTILGPNRQAIGNDAQRVSFWQGSLPFSGDYYIQLRPVQGLNRSDYRLDVNLRSAPQPSPSPTFSPEPSPPNIDTQRVNFPPGTTGTVVSDWANPNVTKRYLVNARRGQVLNVRVLSGAVTLNIRYPSGRLIEDASNVLSWESELPRRGDYKIDVIATQNTNFQLDISVRDLVQQNNQGMKNTGGGWFGRWGNTGNGWFGKWGNGWFGRETSRGENSGRWNNQDRNPDRSTDGNAGRWNDRDRNSDRWNDRNSGRWNNQDRNSGRWNDRDRTSDRWADRNKNSDGQWNRDRNSDRSNDRNSGRWSDRDRTSDRWADRNKNSDGQGNQGRGRWADRNRDAGETNRERNSGQWANQNRDPGGQGNRDRGRWAERNTDKPESTGRPESPPKPDAPSTTAL